MDKVILCLAAFVLMFPLNWARLAILGEIPPGPQSPPIVIFAVGTTLFVFGIALGGLGLRLRKIRLVPEHELLAKHANQSAPVGFFELQDRKRVQRIETRRLAQAANQAKLDHAKTGELVAIVPSRGILRKDELCYASIDASLCETRTVSYQARSSGVSVRVAKGITLRTGASKGRPVQEFVIAAVGELLVTDRRVLFVGDNKSVELKIEALIAFDQKRDGLTLSNASKTHHFRIQPGIDFDVFNIVARRVIAKNA